MPLDDVRRALGSLAIDRDAVWTERVTRAGISATKFCVRGEDAATTHRPRTHAPTGTRQRTTPCITIARARTSCTHPRIARPCRHARASDAGRDRTADRRLGAERGRQGRAKELFQRLGEAEAAIHGTPLDQVHLHEVGALDSIIDIVGTVYALETLGVDRIVVVAAQRRQRHRPVGARRLSGAGAGDAALLEGAPIYAGPQTGRAGHADRRAARHRAMRRSSAPMPPMRVRQIGYGAGTRDFADTPNVLRVLLGDADSDGAVAQRSS